MILITCISLRTTDKTCYPLYIGFCGTPLGPATTILVVLSHVQLFATPWTIACQASLWDDSPGKNTGEYVCVCVCTHAKSLQSCPTLCDPMDCSLPSSFVHRDSPGKNTGMGCHVLLQGIFPSQGLNLGLLHCRHILYCLSHQGS